MIRIPRGRHLGIAINQRDGAQEGPARLSGVRSQTVPHRLMLLNV